MKDKIEASIMLASYLETVGFKNGVWEFNYATDVKTLPNYINMWTVLMHHYMVLGGNKLDITGFNSSDDTILILATAEAAIKGGGNENYRNQYIDNYELLLEDKRASGLNTIDTLKLLKKGGTIKIDSMMGGNGAALRTGPIGLIWYKNIERVIEESIISSKVTHNYYIGFLGGMITALFTSFAMKNIPPYKWVEELLELYKNKVIQKYYPKEHRLEDLDEYIGYWKKYQETRISKLKYKNSLDFFIYPEDRIIYLLEYYPNPMIKSMVLKGKNLRTLEFDWKRVSSTGLDACIIAYDCLLMSMSTPGSKNIDFDNIVYNFDSFMTLVTIHPGDNDTTAAIGGTWYGALLGFDKSFDMENLKKLEFYKELKKVSDKIANL